MKKVVTKMVTVDTASTALRRPAQLRKTSSSAPGTSSTSAAAVDVTTDSIDRYRPGNLPSPAVYVDVEGVDPLQPAYMGKHVRNLYTEQQRTS